MNAQATRIRFDDGRKAVGVDFLMGDEPQFVEAEREVILCGGAYGSPHLLLLSGLGDRTQLARRHWW